MLGRKFKIRTYHAALTWLRHTPDPIGQQARWLEQMEEYDFVIEHRPGVKYGNADSMSRIPCVKRDCYCKESSTVNDTEQNLVRPSDHAQTTELNCFQVTENIESDVQDKELFVSWSFEDLIQAQRDDKEIKKLQTTKTK